MSRLNPGHEPNSHEAEAKGVYDYMSRVLESEIPNLEKEDIERIVHRMGGWIIQRILTNEQLGVRNELNRLEDIILEKPNIENETLLEILRLRRIELSPVMPEHPSRRTNE